MIDLGRVVGFDWDADNLGKNARHGVENREIEEVFFNQPLLLAHDPGHSITESRYRALGRTDRGRCLMVIFALRVENTLIRVISARLMNRKERASYGEQN
jgi:uncharacterized DUF497 family protein